MAENWDRKVLYEPVLFVNIDRSNKNCFIIYLQKVLRSIRNMKKILTCLMAVLGLTSACGQQNYENVDVQGFAELVADTNVVVVLDVRTVDEFKEGHIEGAVNIDQAQGDFIERVKTAMSTDKTIAVYCRSGRRSANAAGKLAAEGYKCVNLKGGILAWKEANMPVTTK